MEEGDFKSEVLEGQTCPMCVKDTLTLTQTEREVPYFGLMYIFSMTCTTCKYHKADLEAKEHKEPCKWSMEVDSEADMQVRVIKSAEATLKIPHVITVESGPAADGYITNVEGVLTRVKDAVQSARDNEEDPDAQKKAKNLLKKLQKVMWGQEKVKLIIEDPTGNSAIISEKAVKSKL